MSWAEQAHRWDRKPTRREESAGVPEVPEWNLFKLLQGSGCFDWEGFYQRAVAPAQRGSTSKRVEQEEQERVEQPWSAVEVLLSVFIGLRHLYFLWGGGAGGQS